MSDILIDILCRFVLYTCTYILYTDIHVVDVQLLYTHGHTQLHIYTCSDIHEYTHICPLICTCDTCSYTIQYTCAYAYKHHTHEYTLACMHLVHARMYMCRYFTLPIYFHTFTIYIYPQRHTQYILCMRMH